MALCSDRNSWGDHTKRDPSPEPMCTWGPHLFGLMFVDHDGMESIISGAAKAENKKYYWGSGYRLFVDNKEVQPEDCA